MQSNPAFALVLVGAFFMHTGVHAQAAAQKAPVAAAGAHAPMPSGPLPNGTAATLTQMGDELALMKAKHQQLEWELKLAKQRTELDQHRRADAGASTAPKSVVSPGLPKVLGIDGVGRRAQATLQMDDGTLVEAAEGAQLPNGMRIHSIRSDGLSLMTAKKQRVDLPVVRVSVLHNTSSPTGVAPLPLGAPGAASPPLPLPGLPRPGSAR